MLFQMMTHRKMNLRTQREVVIVPKPLRILNGKGSKESFFYPVCYAVRLKKSKRAESDEKLKKDFHDGLQLQFDLVRKQVISDFNFSTLERQCFLVNRIMMNFKYIFRFSEPRNLIFSNSKRNNKKGFLNNFAKVTGKHLCQSLLFNKVAG